MAHETDLRIIKTLEAIHGSFEKLSKRTALTELTVADLCRDARISKKTFYRHYPSLDALANEYLEGLVSEFFQTTSELSLPEDTAEFIESMMLFLCDKGKESPTYECVLNGTDLEALARLFVSKATDLSRINTRKFGRLSAAEISLVLLFEATSTLGMYRQWVSEGKHLSPKRLSAMAAQLTNSEKSLRQ